MEDEVVFKLSGQRDAVEIALKRLKELFKMSVAGPVKANDSGEGVHVFITVNPRFTNKVVEL